MSLPPRVCFLSLSHTPPLPTICKQQRVFFGRRSSRCTPEKPEPKRNPSASGNPVQARHQQSTSALWSVQAQSPTILEWVAVRKGCQQQKSGGSRRRRRHALARRKYCPPPANTTHLRERHARALRDSARVLQGHCTFASLNLAAAPCRPLARRVSGFS